MAAAAAVFTKTFNVSADLDGAGYIQLITDLRATLSQKNQGKLIQGCPVLPKLGAKQEFFDVELKVGAKTAKIRLRPDNLYVDGYQWGTVWYEFKTTTKMITGSKDIGFEGGYGQLEGEATSKVEGAKYIKRVDIPLGWNSLMTAVTELDPAKEATDATKFRQNRARSLLIIVQMLSEATRLNNVQHYITENWTGGANPTQLLVDCENTWGKLSESLIKIEPPAATKKGPPQAVPAWTLESVLKTQTGVSTREECVAVVAMVYSP